MNFPKGRERVMLGDEIIFKADIHSFVPFLDIHVGTPSYLALQLVVGQIV